MRIYRNREFYSLSQLLYYRHHPFYLFFLGDNPSPRPSRFSPDINNVSAFLNNPFSLFQCTRQVFIYPVFAERIRRKVQDPHDISAGTEFKTFHPAPSFCSGPFPAFSGSGFFSPCSGNKSNFTSPESITSFSSNFSARAFNFSLLFESSC